LARSLLRNQCRLAQHQPVESCLTAGGIRGDFVSSRANGGSHPASCAELASFE
jgi:hypothetical protein